MNKIKEILKKYRFTFIIVLGVLFVAIATFIVFSIVDSKRIKIKNFNNSIYSLQYDSTWNLKEKEKNYALLEHVHGATINIDVTSLNDEYLYTNFENIIDEVSFSILQDNPEYYLIGEESIPVTANKYDGYQLLYENGENEVLVTIFRKEDKMVTIIYECSYDYFDILLDSVKDIIYNFDLVNAEYESTYNIVQLDSKPLKLGTNKEVAADESRNEDLANRHYYVEYSIPSNFKQYDFNRRSPVYFLDLNGGGRINIYANVYTENVYEILDELKIGSYDYGVGKAKEEGYLDLETFTVVTDKEYIYHAQYTNPQYDSMTDLVYLIYHIDNGHTFVVKVDGYNTIIDKSIIDNISLVKFSKYADDIERNVKDGNLINEFKYAYYDVNNNKKYALVTLYTPESYAEYDDGFSNNYEAKKFRKNYNEDEMIYYKNVRYEFVTVTLANSIESVEYLYDYPKSARKYIGFKTYNNRKYDVYSYEFNKNDKKVYSYAMYYEISDGNFLEIVVESIDSRIGDNEIISLTKFDIDVHDMK